MSPMSELDCLTGVWLGPANTGYKPHGYVTLTSLAKYLISWDWEPYVVHSGRYDTSEQKSHIFVTAFRLIISSGHFGARCFITSDRNGSKSPF